MKFILYSILDLKSGYMSPVAETNDAVAMRNFAHAASSLDSVLHTHFADFRLVALGEFDSELGVITPYDSPRPVCDGKDVVNGF